MRAFMLILGFVAVSAASAPAQEMPSWAAPQDLPDRPASAPELGPFECPEANPNCTDITPAPVDGGLALLALLGTGYAVRRLRRDSDDD